MICKNCEGKGEMPLIGKCKACAGSGQRFETLRALSWREPYLGMMPWGKIETRTWNTPYRGLVLMCASKKPYRLDEALTISNADQIKKIQRTLCNWREINGKAIYIGELFNCRPMTPEDEDDTYVMFSEKLFCHEYRNVIKLDDPLEWSGLQRWGTVDLDLGVELINTYYEKLKKL